MLALRYVALLAIGLWVGGLAALGGLFAPAVFDVLGARVQDGRLLAGAVFGEAFRRFHYVSYACGAVLFGSLAARAILGPRPRRFAVRMGIAILMIGASLVSGLIVTPRIEALQHEVGVPPSTLSASDARRARFGRLHGLSTGIQLLPLTGGLLLLFWELRD